MFRRFLAVTAATLLFAALALSVSAATPDWENVDWESFDWTLIQDSNNDSSLYVWLRDEASSSDVIRFWRCYLSAKQEWGSEDYAHTAYLRFAAAPEAFLIALAKEDPEAQQLIVHHLGIYIGAMADPAEAVPMLEGIKLSKEKNPQAVKLMLSLIDTVQAKFVQEGRNISITVPQTGDPVMAAVAALLLSGAAWIAVKKKK